MNADPPVRHPRVKGGALFRLLRRLAATERELRHVQRLNRHLTSELAHRQHQQPLLVPYPVPNSDAPGTPPHIALLLALWIR
ncbi:MAG: hypothetical protein HOV68_05230, partial [Streptomycetaceae bacterium]|nr:hypothetical protein [Streptomycetaceae bacterium]